MAVQTRSVLKTYFETGDKPTSAQFGDLIDSALMSDVNSIGQAVQSFTAAANTVYNANSAITLSVALNALAGGESCVINRLGNTSVCNAQINFSNTGGLIYYANGYSDVSADAAGAMSYAILAVNTVTLCLINRAFYK